jgi:hypothetical protein
MDVQDEDGAPRMAGRRYLTDPFAWPILQLEQMQRTLAYFSRDDSPFPKRHRDAFAEVVALLASLRRELQQRPEEVTHERLAEDRGSLAGVTSAPSPSETPQETAPHVHAKDQPDPHASLDGQTTQQRLGDAAPLLPSLYPHRAAHWLLVLAAQARVPRRTIYSWWQEYAVARHIRTQPKHATTEQQAAFVAWVRGQQQGA